MRWFSESPVVVAGLVLSLTFATMPVAHAQEASPVVSHAPCPATSPEENKALVERYWAEVWTAGGAAAVTEVLAPEEIHHWGIGGDSVGPAAFTERLASFLTAFPDFAIHIEQLVAEDEFVVSYYTATGTQQGAWLGIAASGTRWSTPASTSSASAAARLPRAGEKPIILACCARLAASRISPRRLRKLQPPRAPTGISVCSGCYGKPETKSSWCASTRATTPPRIV